MGDVQSIGYIENIDGTEIVGWSADPSREDFSDHVNLIIGSYSYLIETTYARIDVEIKGFNNNKCGFRFDLNRLSTEHLMILLQEESGSNFVSLTGKSNNTGNDLVVNIKGIDRKILTNISINRKLTQEFGAIGHIDGIRQGSIIGWCIFSSKSDAIPYMKLKIDGVLVSQAKCNLIRSDVSQLYDVLYSGFELPLPMSAFDGRPHLVEVTEVITGLDLGAVSIVIPPLRQLGPSSDATHELRSFLDQGHKLLEKIQNSPSQTIPIEGGWNELFLSQYRTSQSTLDQQRLLQSKFLFRPKYSVICPVWNTDLTHLTEAISSVVNQTYDEWELILSDDNSPNSDVRFVLEMWKNKYPDKIKLIFNDKNLGISENTNRAIKEASGDYVVFFDHDDIIEPDALYAFTQVQQKTTYKLIYTDEDSIGTDGKLCWPHFKPSWDPILLAGLNYVCHLVCVERKFAENNLYLDANFDGAQDKEFLLRLAQHLESEDVLHIPRVLYHWRHHAASTSKDVSKTDKILERSARASKEWATAYFGQKVSTQIAEPKELFGIIIKPECDFSAKLSIIIPTKDRYDLLIPCVKSILECNYPNLEIIIIDHETKDAMSGDILNIISNIPSCKIISYQGEFNWSVMNNFAANKATGNVLLFLNNDTEIVDKNTLEQLIVYAQNPKIGVVGAKLLYSNSRIQHAGVVIGPAGIAGHGFVGLPRDDLGYFGYLRFPRSVSAVTGACLMVRTDVFHSVAGFEQDKMRVGLSDVDFCLKVQAQGLRNVIVSPCELIHYESVSRGSDSEGVNAARFQKEANAFRVAHSSTIEADPYYNPAFDSRSDPYRYLRIGSGPAYDARKHK